ncbi:sensor histidine kinase [Echinococcus multilocularis]|uniref:Sensor histidine kinase n=1 Tax=Echinococcus multilocularis TaxID=6211 RepID=A0A0S4MM50_ECHMU|nr:sensor histidine kinase [Echinococcus multilocularis]
MHLPPGTLVTAHICGGCEINSLTPFCWWQRRRTPQFKFDTDFEKDTVDATCPQNLSMAAEKFSPPS